MKRNETILVYAVTGLLSVIVLIAVFVGQETKTGDDRVAAEARPEQLMDESDPSSLSGVLDSLGQDADADVAAVAEEADAAAEATDTTATSAEPVPAVSEGVDADAAAQAASLQAQPLSTELVRSKLGQNEVENQYRWVTVVRGDSLSTLVQRWCVTLDQLPLVEAVNESVDLQRLRPGQKILVPLVDDQLLLKAHSERSKALADLNASRGQAYTIKSGDLLWNIAVSRVGAKQAPAFLVKVKALNPGISDLGQVRVGQVIRLP